MAFTNQTVISLQDFVEKLDAFVVANGWTQDQLNTGAGKAAWHKSTVFFQVRWSTATPNNLGIYQSLAFSGTGVDPGNHTDDSGNGEVSGTDSVLDDGRFALITNTPVRFWAFASGDYVHVAVQTTGNLDFVHLGAGKLTKIGDWVGGEYVYGHRTNGTGVQAINAGSTYLLDGILTHAAPGSNKYAATLHLEALPGMGGSSKWGVFLADDTPGLDRAGNARVLLQGGYRGGPVARVFGRYEANPTKGLVPISPQLVFYRRTNATKDTFALGFMPDVRQCQIRHFAGGDELTVGSDTWVLFPSGRKDLASPNTNTGLQGIGYKKIP